MASVIAVSCGAIAVPSVMAVSCGVIAVLDSVMAVSCGAIATVDSVVCSVEGTGPAGWLLLDPHAAKAAIDKADRATMRRMP